MLFPILGLIKGGKHLEEKFGLGIPQAGTPNMVRILEIKGLVPPTRDIKRKFELALQNIGMVGVDTPILYDPLTPNIIEGVKP